jgi:hypothetical protein
MRPIIDRSEADEFDALVVRVDHRDDAAWRTVTALLAEPTGDEGIWEPSTQLVDDPAFDGATVDEVLAAAAGDGMLRVLFLADAATMRGEHPLLAVSTLTREECEDDEHYAEEMAFGREFRIVPAAVAELHGNLAIANMSFFEFAESASRDPDGIHRGFIGA